MTTIDRLCCGLVLKYQAEYHTVNCRSTKTYENRIKIALDWATSLVSQSLLRFQLEIKVQLSMQNRRKCDLLCLKVIY